MLEIPVFNNDIERAIKKLQMRFQKEISRDLLRHSYFESRTQREKRKKKRSVMRLKKLAARSISRVDTAKRRESRDKREA